MKIHSTFLEFYTRTDGHGDSDTMLALFFCNVLFRSPKYLHMRISHATFRLEFQTNYINKQNSF